MAIADYVPREDKYPSDDAGYSGEEMPTGFIDWKTDFTVPDSMKSTWSKNKQNIMDAAKITGVDPALILSHMHTESRGDSNAVSKAGAIGTMQVLPGTGMEMGFTPEDLKDPQKGTLAGAMYIQKMLNQFGGNLKHATSAYFDGPGNVGKSLQQTGDIRKGPGNVSYLNKVLGGYGQMRDLPDDYDLFTLPFGDGKVRTTGGNTSDPGSFFHTPSEMDAFGLSLDEGTRKLLRVQSREMTSPRMEKGWYGVMERATKDKDGNHAVVPDDIVWPTLFEESERHKGGLFSDLGKAFMHGLTTSATSMTTAVGALGAKMDAPGGRMLLNKSLEATAALDKYYELNNPRFLTTLASGFGSTLPLFLGGGIGMAISKGMLATAVGKRLSARMALAMADGGAVTTLMQRIGAKGIAFNIGMSVPEATMEAGGVFNQALNEGKTEDEAYAAAQKTFLGNAALLPVTNVPYTIPGIRAWVKVLGGGIVEGMQENFQENISEAALAKRDWSEIWKPDQGEAIAVGFIIGSIMHGAKMAVEEGGGGGKKDTRPPIADRVAALMGVGRPKGGVDPTTAEEIDQATILARDIAQMPDSDLAKLAEDRGARLDALDDAIAGNKPAEGVDPILGTPEELQAERARTGIEFAVAWREYMVRDVQRRLKKSNTTPAELDQLIKNMSERNKKRGDVTGNEMEQALIAVQVLARNGELKEPILKGFTDAFPMFRPALDVMRETTKAAETAAPEKGPGEKPVPGKAPVEPGAAPSPSAATETPGATQARLKENVAKTRELIIKKGDITPKEVAIELDVPEAHARVLMKRALGEPEGGRVIHPLKDENVPQEIRDKAEPVVKLAEAMGVRVVWTEDTEGALGTYIQGGLVKKGAKGSVAMLNPVALAENPQYAVDFVLAHEVGHHIVKNPEMRSLMRDLLADVQKTTDELLWDIDGKRRSYRTEKLTEEVLADMLAYELIKPGQQALISKHLSRSSLQKIIDAMVSFIKNITLRPGESGEVVDILESRLALLEKQLTKLAGGPSAGAAKLSEFRTTKQASRGVSKAKKAGVKAKKKGTARKLKIAKKASKKTAAKAKKGLLAKASKSLVKRGGLTEKGKAKLGLVRTPLKLTPVIGDLESRQQAMEQIQATEERIAQIQEAITSGTLGIRSFSFVKKDKNGKPMISMEHVSYGRWEVRYTNHAGESVIEEATSQKRAKGLRDHLVKAETNELLKAKNALRGRQQDLVELRAAVTEFDRTGVEEPGATDVEAELTPAQQVLDEEISAVEGAAETEVEDQGLAAKLRGKKARYAYGDGVDLNEVGADELENEANSHLAWINQEDALKLINSVNREQGRDIPLSVLDDGTVKSKKTMFETFMYSLGDIVDLMGARESASPADARAVAIAELGETRRRAEDLIDSTNEMEAHFINQERIAKDALFEAEDYEWLGQLDTGATPRSDEGSPSPAVQEMRSNLLDARSKMDEYTRRRLEMEDRLNAISSVEESPLARINSLLAQLAKLRDVVDYNYKKGYYDRVQDALDKIAEVTFQLESINFRDTTWSEFNPISTIAELGRLAGDVITGNYATGRVEGTKVKEISKNPDVQRVFDQQSTEQSLDPRPERSPRRWANEKYRDGFDNLHMTKVAVDDAVGGPATAKALSDRGLNHYVNMRGIARGWARAARWFLEREVVSFLSGKVLYKRGLKKILKAHNIAGDQAKYERLGLHMLAKRIVYLSDPILGDPTVFRGTPSEIKAYQDQWRAVLDDTSKDPDLEAAALELSDFNKALVQFMNEMGVFKEGEFNNIVNTPFYAPLYDIDKDATAAGISSDISRDANKGVKALRILDKTTRFMHPVEAMSKNTVRYTNIGYINYVKSRLGELVDMVGDDTFGYHIDLDPSALDLRTSPGLAERTNEELEYRKRAKISLEQAVDGAIIHYGIPKAKQDEIKAAILSADPSLDQDPQVQQVKAWVANAELADDMVAYLDHGELRIMKLNRDLMDGFATLRTESIGKIMNVARTLTNALKTGATLTPDFASRNMIRDSMSNIVGAANMITGPTSAANFVYNWLRSFNSIFSNDENLRGFIMGGGALSEFISLGRDEMKNMVNSLRRQANPKEVFLHPGTAFPVMLDMIKNVSALSETVTRLAVYRTRLGQLEKQNPGLPSYIVSQLAAFDSREGGIDFARVGQQMRVLNHLQPFFTASLGGTDKMVRSMFSPQSDRAGTWVRGFLSVTVPSLALYWLHKDDEWYQARPSWEKNLFWMTKIGDVIVRIPKPFEYGLIFGSLPERLVEYSRERDPHEVKKLMGMLLTQTYGGALDAGGWLTSIVPPISALYHAKSNYDPFRGEKIVKGVREELEAPYQYSASTKEFSKWISNGLYRNMNMSVSPAKIDFWVRSSFAGLGDYALDLLSAPIPTEEAELVPWYNRAPVIKGFVKKDPVAFGRWSDEFYDMLEASRRAVKTRNYLLASKRDVSSMTYELARNGKFAAIYPGMNNISQMAKKATIAVEAIKYDDTLTTNQKREKINNLYLVRERLYQRGVAMAFKVMPEADRISKRVAKKLASRRNENGRN